MQKTSLKDYPFAHPLRVRYSEVDAQGVVFNAHYLTYFDTAITEATRAFEWDWVGQMKSSGHDLQLVKSLVEYHAPIGFDDLIHVAVRIGRIGRSSLQWELAIFSDQDERLLTTGEIIHVYTNLQAGQSAPLPTSMLAMARPLQKSE